MWVLRMNRLLWNNSELFELLDHLSTHPLLCSVLHLFLEEASETLSFVFALLLTILLLLMLPGRSVGLRNIFSLLFLPSLMLWNLFILSQG